MASTQLARGIWTGFAPTERPFGTPNGMDDNLRLIDDHIALYTLQPPVAPGTALPAKPVNGAGQIFTDGSYAVYNSGAWKTYPARGGLLASQANGGDLWFSTEKGGWLSPYQEAIRDITGPDGLSRIGFAQAGAGAVTRLSLDKMREGVSVMDFGAVGNGWADDSAAIQLAIDYLASVGGGRLLFPRGMVFGVGNSIYIKSNVHLIGDGLPKIRAIAPIVGPLICFASPVGGSSTTPNAVNDGGFEKDGTWTISDGWRIVAGAGRGGTRAAVCGPGGTGISYIDPNLAIVGVSVKTGEVWRLRVWYKTTADYNGTTGNGKLRLAAQDGGLVGSIPFTPGKTDYALAELIYTVPSSGVTALRLRCQADNTEGAVTVDDIELKQITDVQVTGLNPTSNASIECIDIDGSDLVTEKNFDPASGALKSALVYIWTKSTFNTIKNCKIHNANCDLVGSEDYADFTQVIGNEIYNLNVQSAATQWANMVCIDGPENATIEGNYIHDLNISTSYTAWGYGIRLHATDGAVVRNNKITTGYHNILVDGRKNLIEQNNLSGSTRSGIVLYYNEYKCLYNTVIGNFINCGNQPIHEDDTGKTGYVGWNLIIGNTAYNAKTNILANGQNTTVLANNIFKDAGVTQYQRADSDGTWTPAVVNTTNVSGAAATGCRYFRYGQLVQIMGTVTCTVTAAGSFEARLSAPTTGTFANEYDVAGQFTDSWSSWGRIYALTSSTYLRLNGHADSAGAKTLSFNATYFAGN